MRKESIEYMTWKRMRNRCNNVRGSDYDNYGGRGIKICERWNDFKLFLQDMGPRPGDGYSIDRIDNDKGYCPENCRWATVEQQANNKRSSRILVHNNESKTLAEWSRETGLKSHTIFARIAKGWSVSDALTKPLEDKTTIAKGVTICKSTGRYRVAMSVNGKTKYLGRYRTKEEAIEARKQGELKYWS